MSADQNARRTSPEFRRIMSSLPVPTSAVGGGLIVSGYTFLGCAMVAVALLVDFYNYAVWWKR